MLSMIIDQNRIVPSPLFYCAGKTGIVMDKRQGVIKQAISPTIH